MKFLITETQSGLLGLEKISDIMYKFLISMYPENYKVNEKNRTVVYSNKDYEYILFFYYWDDWDFYIAGDFILELFNVTGISLFNINELFNYQTGNKKDRETFNELMKVFAKRHYGWDVNKVWFHWH